MLPHFLLMIKSGEFTCSCKNHQLLNIVFYTLVLLCTSNCIFYLKLGIYYFFFYIW
ncbi:hypothetical protein BTJ45_03328 [Bacillus mycoides]|nr:hypothetical protein BTJ45_03328 [Bacillus mycoides]